VPPTQLVINLKTPKTLGLSIDSGSPMASLRDSIPAGADAIMQAEIATKEF
jgi:hypothetical protein